MIKFAYKDIFEAINDYSHLDLEEANLISAINRILSSLDEFDHNRYIKQEYSTSDDELAYFLFLSLEMDIDLENILSDCGRLRRFIFNGLNIDEFDLKVNCPEFIIEEDGLFNDRINSKKISITADKLKIQHNGICYNEDIDEIKLKFNDLSVAEFGIWANSAIKYILDGPVKIVKESSPFVCDKSVDADLYLTDNQIDDKESANNLIRSITPKKLNIHSNKTKYKAIENEANSSYDYTYTEDL